MKGWHYFLIGMLVFFVPFVWRWMTLPRADLVLTVFLLALLAYVVFECAFKVLRDFGGFPDE